MDKVLETVGKAQQSLKTLISTAVSEQKGIISQAQYLRYLSMQYHLVKGVQQHFLLVAAHPSLYPYKQLREFLVGFAFEEESHYLIAEKDIRAMGGQILECPLDVKLWKSYYAKVIYEQPFLRLGATCILENISFGSSDMIDSILSKTSFLSVNNTKFLQIHRHQENDHGNQIIAALTSANLKKEEMGDLEIGAKEGATMFLRLLKWSLIPAEDFVGPF